MNCPSCQHINREGRAFCAQCGSALPSICGSCGFENEAGDRFCGGCGTALTVATASNSADPGPRPTHNDSRAAGQHPSDQSGDEAELRPLTIMFTDLVGSTEMSMQMDQEELREVITGYQSSCTKVIEQYGGFIARYMGDGIMSYFGYPKAHEDDAEHAIRAGLEVVEAVRSLDADIGAEKGVRLQVRVGLASGLVVVGDLIGKGASQERAVVGETPNLAARMQGLADPDGVVIDPAAFRLAGAAFKTKDLGMREVKGCAKPIRLRQVVAPRNTQSRLDSLMSDRLSPLVGRNRELSQLRELWKRAKLGEGKAVMLSGDPGIGKTRLARTALNRIAGEDTLRIRYQCTPLYTNSAFNPFIEQIEHAAGIDRAESAGLRFRKMQVFLRRFSQDTEEHRALLARLLSITPEGHCTELNLGPVQLKQRTISVLAEQWLMQAEKRPMLVLFEDIQWADPSSLELLERIIAAIEEAAILLICTHRSDYSTPWDELEWITKIRLDRLDAAQSSALVDRLLDESRVPAELKREILHKTDGVPLFVEEMIRSLSADVEESGANSALPLDLVVPDTLQSSLMSRLDRLDSAKTVAQTGAAIGRLFRYDLLTAVVPMVSAELDSELDSLQLQALVNRRGQPPESVYTFRHGLIRDAAYQSLLRSRRREIHRRIAFALEHEFKSYWEFNPEVLAHHLTEAGEIEKAIDYWEAAARKAAQGSANIEAERHFRRAIDLIGRLPPSAAIAQRELGLQTGMGTVLINNHGPGSPAVTALYRRCRTLCEELGHGDGVATTEEQFATLWGVWRTCESLNVAMDLVAKMRELGEKEKRDDLLMQAHHSGWATLFNLGELRACMDSIVIGEALYDVAAHRDHASLYGGHDPQVCAHGVGAVALCLQGFPDQAALRVERAIDDAKRLEQPGSLAHALDFAVTYDRMGEQPQRALPHAEALIRCAAQNEFADYEIRGRAFRGWALAKLGKPSDGLVELRASLLAQRETGTSEDFSLFLEMLAEACGLAGDPEAGLSAIDEALQDALHNEAAFWLSATRRRQALLMVQKDKCLLSEAADTLRDAISIAKRQQAYLLELQASLDLARLLDQTAEAQAARDTLVECYQRMSEGYDLPVMIGAREFIARTG